MLFVLLVKFLFIILKEVNSDEYEYRLYSYLNQNYSVLERPVTNNSEAVIVLLGVVLQQIVDVDEKNQVIHLNAWLKYTWNDYKLRWNPKDFGNLQDIRFPAANLWKPDVLLYNSVDASFDSTYPSNMVAYSDGSVVWIPPGIFQISCKIDITWFPFDEQLCYMKFGSWTYDGLKLDLQPDPKAFDTSEYLENGEWALIETPVNRTEKFYACCPEPYPDLKFYLRMRRRTLYYGFNLILPSLLISLMTILGFTLPPDAGEKVTLEITILLSVCFFLSMVAEMSPPTSEAVPLLEGENSSVRNTRNHEYVVSNPEVAQHRKESKELEHRIGECLRVMAHGTIVLDAGQQAVLLMMQRIHSELRYITKRIEQEDEDDDAARDWRFAAMVVDRLCFLIFTVFIIASSYGILCSAPYLVA